MTRASLGKRGGIALLALFSSVALATAIFAPSALAASCGSVETSIIDCSSANDTTGSAAVALLVTVIQILTGAIGIVAIGALVYAGILYASASGNSSQVAKAKELIANTVIGLVLFAGMGLLLNYLIPGGLFSGTAKFGATDATEITLGGGVGAGSGGINDKDNSNITSTKPAQVTLASWNTYVSNTTNKGSAAKSILGSADVLGMQEVHKAAQRTDVKKIASNTIGVYFAPTPSSGDKHMASYPIVYNKSKIDFMSGGFRRLGSTPGLTDRYAVYALLRLRATGQQFYFVNTHLPPGVESGGTPKSNSKATAYKKQMGSLTAFLKSLQNSKMPVFAVGDFNVNYRSDTCKTSWFPCSAMHAVNTKSAFEITKLSGLSSSQGTHQNGTRLIDYVFVHTDSRVSVGAVAVLGGTSSKGFAGSDHKPSLARITITSTLAKKPDGDTPITPPSALKGVKNFRDLATLNSSIIKPGVLYRSAKLQDATTADKEVLSKLLAGGAIIDFRTATVRSRSPDVSISGVPNLNYPVEGVSDAEGYIRAYVTSESGRKQFGAAITKIANTDGAVLFHCTAGKDRTGWMAAMLMYIMGASDTQVMTEYLKSQDAGADFEVDKAWLNAALSAARKNNGGSIMNYITSPTKGLGVSTDTIAKLKAKLAP